MKITNIPIFIILLIISTMIPSCYVVKTIYYNLADIKDYKKFRYHTIEAQKPYFNFAAGNREREFNLSLEELKAFGNGKFPFTIKAEDLSQGGLPLEKLLNSTKTVAFLIIKNDTILYEKYFHKYDEASVTTSFSMAKSFTSALIGIAISEGFIQNINQPITDYIPELKDKGFEKIKIKNLLQMTSGIKFTENYYNPFSNVDKLYYGNNILKIITHLKIDKQPGKEYRYISINSQLLGLILQRATGKNISEYLQEKIWIPLGMEYDATWSIDSKKNGMEKTYCCLNARARDFAKFGRLYLNKGNWNGKQIISREWIKESTKIDTTNGSRRNYQYGWWIMPFPPKADQPLRKSPVRSTPGSFGESFEQAESPVQKAFWAKGHLGQFIFVYPQENVIIVRLGKKRGKVNWGKVFLEIVEKI
ncbi:MAG: serine hydrolase [Bacteroidetes bacterium]|nr:serine hydrolase [Bacteroidota bacterium]